MTRRLASICAVLGVLTTAPAYLAAETLSVGIRVPPTAFDPQLSGVSSDYAYNSHVFNMLFYQHATTLQPIPHLATSAKLIDDRTWELQLRRGVKFHNGADFTAADVAFTFQRLPNVPNSDRLSANFASPVKKVEIVDPHTVRLITDVPTPDMVHRLMFVSIICACVGPNPTTEDFNNGKATIGTGPYKFVEWKRGNQAVLDRFDGYWGDKPEFERIVLREMPNDAGRVAALQAGDVQLIDFVPPLDVKRLKQSQTVTVQSETSARVIFLQLDTLRDNSPQVTDAAGQPMTKNPLKDLRVRQALKMAVNQDIIISRVMDGLATKVTQGVPVGIFGHDPKIPAAKVDAAGARKLLADAGYPNGFGLTLSCPNDRYVNDADICQAVGQMWSQIGIKAKIDAAPKSVFFRRLLNSELSAYLLGWGNNNGMSISFMQDVVATRNKEKARGSWNSVYSNPALDVEIDRAISAMDPKVQEPLLQAVMAKAVEDVAFIPLHAQQVVLATKAGLKAVPRGDEGTLASDVVKTK